MHKSPIAILILTGMLLIAAFGVRPSGPEEKWKKQFAGPITGLAVAGISGEVVAATDSEVLLFRDKSSPAWTATQKDWLHLEGLAISRDGGRIIFQTDTKPKAGTESMTLNVHLLDRDGKEIWQKPNPDRYLSLLASPSGQYLIFGELFHPGIHFCDGNMKPLWQKDVSFWHLRLDPTEKYLVDGEGGKVYTVEGAPVMELGPWAKILSVSDDASFVMTQWFRTVKASENIFLGVRRENRKIELKGTGGCLSPDGSLAALVSLDGKLGLYRTVDLVAAGMSAKPLFTVGFKKPWMMQISRDNQTLLALGVENDQRSVLMLVDLAKERVAWKQEVDPSVRVASAPEDNREVTLQLDARTLACYRCR